jgi:hypothetical protein
MMYITAVMDREREARALYHSRDLSVDKLDAEKARVADMSKKVANRRAARMCCIKSSREFIEGMRQILDIETRLSL